MAQYKGGAQEGQRAKLMMKRREKQQEEIALLKQKITDELDNKTNVSLIDSKFASHFDVVEQELKSSTIGLVTLDEMKAKQETVIQEHEKRIATELRAKEKEKERKRKNKEKEKTQKRSKLSFDFGQDDDEEEDDTGECSFVEERKRLGKNPEVDTSFLPDRDREEDEKRERERLRQEWIETQTKIKNEEIEITYSYWDGSGHRKKCQMKKGDTIQRFLQQCLRDLRNEYTELRAVDVVSLMYVKEDIIIPHHHTFYDFIINKARGKSGPLFAFDAHEDIRLISDSSLEKDESHAGKVCLRSWYEKNKHIFPASRWEPYDPEKKWEKYTINDK